MRLLGSHWAAASPSKCVLASMRPNMWLYHLMPSWPGYAGISKETLRVLLPRCQWSPSQRATPYRITSKDGRVFYAARRTLIDGSRQELYVLAWLQELESVGTSVSRAMSRGVDVTVPRVGEDLFPIGDMCSTGSLSRQMWAWIESAAGHSLSHRIGRASLSAVLWGTPCGALQRGSRCGPARRGVCEARHRLPGLGKGSRR